MAAIYMDGFDTYGTGLTGNANLLKSQWTTISSDGSAGVLRTPAWGARTGTYAMTCVVAPSQSNVLQLRTSLSTVLMSLGFAITALPTSSLQSNICSFGSSTGGVVAQLWCQPDGTIALTDSTNTVIASSASGVISQAATWYFLEMSYSQSAGTFTLRVNDNLGTGTPLIQAVSLSLGSTAVNQIGFVGSARTYYDWVDDIFIRSSTGTYNAGWLGARSIGTLATVATYTAGSNIVLGTPLATTTLTSAIQVGYVSPSGSYTGIGSTFTTTNSNTAIVTNTVPSAVNNYFNDIYDADPNTSSVLSPFAIANGTVSINPTGGADTNITQVTVLIAYGTGIISSSALPAWTFVLDGHRFYV